MTETSTPDLVITSDNAGLTGYLKLESEMVARCRPEGAAETAFVSTADFVLREGRDHQPADYDPTEWGGFQGEPRMCFQNALHLAMNHRDELVYVEGYGLRLIPTQHAYCVRRGTDEVVDPTWNGEHGNGQAYRGVAFDLDFVFKTVMSRGYYGMIDDPENGWPLLRNGLPDGVLGEDGR